MKSPAKKIVTAIILGTVFLNAGLSFAQNDSINSIEGEIAIYSSEDAESAERKREFWEKFRETVTPREKPPSESDKPQEISPEEIDPQEFE